MTFLRSIAVGLVALFVDDWAFALPTLVWIALAAALARHLPPHLPPSLAAPLLFLGLAVLALVSVVRQARRFRSRSRD